MTLANDGSMFLFSTGTLRNPRLFDLHRHKSRLEARSHMPRGFSLARDYAWSSWPFNQVQKLRLPRSFTSFLILTLVTIINRLPHSFQSVIDWDESTHILLGYYWLHGLVPYVDLVEIKPPGVFAVFAALAFAADGSIFVVRLFGSLCVLATAWFIFRSVKLFSDHWIATAVACLVIIMIGALGSAQSTETSLIASVPLGAGLYLLLTGRRDVTTYFLMGVCFSLATSVRSELAIFVVVVSALIFLDTILHRDTVTCRPVAAYILGGLLPLVIILLTVAIIGNFNRFFLLNVNLPLRYSHQMSPRDAFVASLWLWLDLVKHAPYLFGVFPVFVVAGLLAPIDKNVHSKLYDGTLKTRLRKLIEGPRTKIVVTIAGIIASILVSGEADQRYWSKLLPTLAIAGSGLFFMSSPVGFKRAGYYILGVMLVPGLLLSLIMFAQFFTAAVGGRFAFIDAEQRVAAYLLAEMKGPDRLLALDGHIVYWWIDKRPLTPIVHPSLLLRGYLIDALIEHDYIHSDEFDRLLWSMPEYIVKSKSLPYFRRRKGAAAQLDALLKSDYKLAVEFGRLQVYKRKTP